MATVETTTLTDDILQKCPSGIRGLDEITGGGLPLGRTSLFCGGAGSGKTTFAMEFLVRGILDYDEPGVFFSFEENVEELIHNYASMGFPLRLLNADRRLALRHIHIEASEIEESGEYDLEALFIRLGHAIDSVGAKRVVLDTLEALFSALPNEGVLRAELRRLFRWLKDKGVTAIITGEKGEKTLTRHGLEEYVADCVVSLDHRVQEQLSTRRLRIVKYRGSEHGTNEYPFLISKRGILVLPITTLNLKHEVSSERVPTGIDRLDTMLGGGFYRGSSIMVSGTAGSGKSTLATHFAHATCARGERCLYFAFEESPEQIIRNMLSAGRDLRPCIEQGLLRLYATRGTAHGLEQHLIELNESIDEFKPSAVIFDPLTNLLSQGTRAETRAMATRLVDSLKLHGISGMFVTLTAGADREIEASELDISSLIDTWILLRDMESNGERNRCLHILKSRGMAHSNQLREFLITNDGIKLLDVYVGPQGVLTGSSRVAQEARDEADRTLRRQQLESLRNDLDRRSAAHNAQMAAAQAAFEAEMEELRLRIAHEEVKEVASMDDLRTMARLRRADKQ